MKGIYPEFASFTDEPDECRQWLISWTNKGSLESFGGMRFLSRRDCEMAIKALGKAGFTRKMILPADCIADLESPVTGERFVEVAASVLRW